MKYHYLPQSVVAHESSMLLEGLVPTPATQVLEPAREVEHGPREAIKLRDAIRARGGGARITWALAHDLRVGSLIESHNVRFRVWGMIGYAAWHDASPQGVTLRLPVWRRLGLTEFRVMLGLEAPPQFRDCDRVRIPFATPECGAQHVKINKDGSLRAHKRTDGAKCQ